jgi:hypothetical protein
VSRRAPGGALGAALACLALALPGGVLAQETGEPERITDNSFLIEEAYNQDPGVVQHIGLFTRQRGGEAWAFVFTQEWPLASRRHQLSLTVPLLNQTGVPGGGTGFGDLLLSYRYQLAGQRNGDRLLIAPRLSTLLPTGSEAAGRGVGSLGLQADLPLTFVLTPRLATHWNAGGTLVPSARTGPGGGVTTSSYNLGASAVFYAHPRINLLVEAVWVSAEVPVGPGLSERFESTTLMPGVRFSFQFGGLQAVPGVGYAIGLGDTEDALVLYLSLEHRFAGQ